MKQLKVVEIEPAVVAMDRFFTGVNESVLERPGVRVVLDDARSALQLDRTRYDVIVSEPSNPWVAGIATLYTPEFFRIARSRLSNDGVFCQWIQLYQLPLPVVAGIVRSLQAVFPYVHVWFGGTADLVVLASPRPLTYDRQWLGELLGPGGPMHALSREWLSLDSPDDYFGRLLLSDSGVTRLVARATFDHTDNRPRLEFVAARRFLDPTALTYAVFDSLIQMGNRDAATSPFAQLRILGARRSDAGILPYLDAARRAQPNDAEWTVRSAGIRLAMGDTAQADSLLGVATARASNADALQMRQKPTAGAAGPPRGARRRGRHGTDTRRNVVARGPGNALGRGGVPGARCAGGGARHVPPPLPWRVSQPGPPTDCAGRAAGRGGQPADLRGGAQARFGPLP
jgi:hypothetical protein